MQDRIPSEGDRVAAVMPLLSLPLLELVSISLLITLGFLLSGCAVYYRDRDSGAEHIWGFGHLAVKTIPPHEGKQALVQRMTLTGLAVGLDNGSFGVSAGYDRREHILIPNNDRALTITPHHNDDYFYFKIGTYPSDLGFLLSDENTHKKKEP